MPRIRLSAGPWKGVRDTSDPYDDPADPGFLQDAQNCYVADGAGMSGLYARPGFRNGPASISAGVTNAITIHTMVTTSGTTYRFAACNAKLYRFTTVAGNPLAVATDVTPGGVLIDSSTSPTSRFYFGELANQLISTDGVNRPWRASNLSSSSVTATYIDIDGAGTAWTAQGPPVVYQGSLFFIVKTIASSGSSVVPGLGLVWSEPNQPDVGYTQSGYANFWNLIEQSPLPIYCLAANNVGLYYFRESSIGMVAGSPGIDFSTNATHDLVSIGVGCTAPGSIVQFSNNIFFVDRIGRPYLFVPGSVPQELWKQLRGQIDANPTYVTYPAATALTAVGCLCTQLNVVLLGGWSSNPTNSSPTATPLGPTTPYVFDAKTGAYYGRWGLSSSIVSSGIAALAEMTDTNGTPLVTVVSNTGLAYRFYAQQALGAGLWTDGEVSVALYVPTITAKTQRLGYGADTLMGAGGVGTLIVQSSASCLVSVITPVTASDIQASSAAYTPSYDGTYNISFGMDVRAARGIQVEVSPVTANSQWVLQSISFPATTSKAGADDR